jgi:hypothetical protein
VFLGVTLVTEEQGDHDMVGGAGLGKSDLQFFNKGIDCGEDVEVFRGGHVDGHRHRTVPGKNLRLELRESINRALGDESAGRGRAGRGGEDSIGHLDLVFEREQQGGTLLNTCVQEGGIVSSTRRASCILGQSVWLH